MRVWLSIGFAGALIVLNAFLVAAEYAFVRVRTTRLEALRESGSRRAASALGLARRLDSTLATTQVGITLASLGIGWTGEPGFASLLEPVLGAVGLHAWLHPIAFGVAFLVITLLTVVLGELVPRAIGIQSAERIALLAADPLRLLRRLLFPMVALTNRCALAVLRLAGLPAGFVSETVHTEEELRAILALSHDRGHLTRVGRDILEKALGFSRLTARQIMVPRPDVVWLSTARAAAENLQVARSSGYTRFPLCDGDLDRVVGIVHIKDLLPAQGPIDLAAVTRAPIVVPETATADRLLRVFQRRALHMAIVVDEYGGTSGIVTLEDVLEEIVGEVRDEFDEEPPPAVRAGEGRLHVPGSARLAEIAKLLGASDEAGESEVDTVAGYVQDRLGRMAREGDHVVLGEYVLRVDQVRGNRIVSLTALQQPARVASTEREGGAEPASR